MTARAKHAISITDALSSRKLFADFYPGDSWDLWRGCLKAMFGEPLTASELVKFREVAERDPPKHRTREFVCFAGRGSGKDSAISGVAVYTAMSFDPRAAKLRPGENVFVLCFAVDKNQAAVCFRMIRAFFEEVPALRALVKNIGNDSIELRNKVVVEIHTANYRSVRGRSLLSCVFDEASFWRDADSANPDIELYAAARPGLSRVPGSMLTMITSAHRRSGLAYERWRKHYGQANDDVLVVRGTTLQFNPTADRALIEADLAEDPQKFGAEYLSIWRDDLSSYVSRDLIEAAIDRGVTVRSPQPGLRYFSFVDPSGGGPDSFTAAVCHAERDGLVVLDCLVEIMGGNPESAARDISTVLKSYGLRKTTGDRYAKNWPVMAFARNGITMEHSELDRSALYLECLPLFSAGRVKLLDNRKLAAQFWSLERRAFPSGQEKVNHSVGGHDDCCNAAAGALVLAAQRKPSLHVSNAVLLAASRPTNYSRLHGRPNLMGARLASRMF